MIPDNAKPVPWRKYSDALSESMNYIEKRAAGDIKSLKTHWSQFNSIGLNGVEWGNSYILASRPGVGKSLLIASLTRQIQELNKNQDFYILHFQFEMSGKNIAAREIASANNMNLRYLLSAKDKNMIDLTSDDLSKVKDYVSKQTNRKEYIIDAPMTVREMKATLYAFYQFVKKPFVVTLDHTMLVKKDASETNKQQTMENLAAMTIETKKALPITWFILSQLNRDIDSAERQIPGKLSNFPCDADIYQSDAFIQGADVVIAYNRPAKYQLKYYGPESYVLEISDKYLIAAHILKNRFGELGIHWYKADYAKMNFLETDPPPKKDRK